VDLQPVTRALPLLLALLGGGCATASSPTSGGDDDDDAIDAATGDGGDDDPADAAAIDAATIDAEPVMVEMPRISYWSGKVNIHRDPGGAWTNADCSSGAGIDPLTYCQSLYPLTVSITEVTLSSKPDPVWWEGGCSAVHLHDGVQEWTCNQPPAD
jgi:hypothetical protein